MRASGNCGIEYELGIGVDTVNPEFWGYITGPLVAN